jgi:predicted TIM-barrel fold metal-dependent hydrolase
VIVDVHTHTPTHRDAVPDDERLVFETWRNDRAVVTTTSWADFDEAQRDADVSIVFNIAVSDPLAMTGLPYDPETCNDATAAFVADRPDRRIGFMGVDPRRPDLLDEVERCRELGLVGIKLGPNYQGFDPLSPEARRLYAYAERQELPILFHQGTSPVREAPIRFAHPLVMDEVAIAHPELRVVMAHMGHPWPRETAVVIRKHPHVYADVSSLMLRPWICWEALVMAVEWGATGKLLLGSDFPISNAGETIAQLARVNDIVEGTQLPRVPGEVLSAIVHADALGALGLEHAR